jgi:hypothetical protein
VEVGVTNASPILTANATGATFQWLDCDNNFAVIAGETNQVFAPTVNGNYAVEVTQNNCTDTSTCEVVNNVDITEYVFDSGMTVYPNPTSGELSIDLGATFGEVTLIIRNQLGQEILRKSFEGSNLLKHTLTGEAGIYYFEVRFGDKNVMLRVVKD